MDDASAPAPRSGLVLAFDASTPRSVVALGRVGADASDDELLHADEELAGGRQASAQLADRLSSAIRGAGLEPRDLDLVAVGRGPGTFTGARVAVATAKGVALGLGVRVVPLSSLAPVASDVHDADEILALLDARRGEVYGARFRRVGGDLLPAGPERCGALADWAARDAWPESLRLHGPGVAPHLDAIPAPWRARASSADGPSGAGLWAAAASAVRRGQAVHPRELDVVYLRVSYAEMGINTPRRPLKRSPFL